MVLFKKKEDTQMFNFFKMPNINNGVAEFKDTDGAVLIDVRTKAEYRDGHVPGSKNIQLEKINSATSIIKDKTTPVFVYCLSGSRSNMAVKSLKNMGYTDVRNIGGISSYSGTTERGK